MILKSFQFFVLKKLFLVLLAFVVDTGQQGHLG
jgi:hypothetical protein